MIAMLEKNPKLRFKGDKWIDGSVLQLDKEGHIEIVSYPGNRISAETVLAYIPSRINWTLVREPVPVWEAIKAYVEGKNISCNYEESWDGYPKKKSEILFTHKEYEGVGFTSHLLLNGIWYIEDSPDA